MAGYSPKPLAEKLGLAGGRTAALPRKALILGAPDGYPGTLGALPPSTRLNSAPAWRQPLAGQAPFDFIQAFFRSEPDLERAFPVLKKAMAVDGMLWISWPKRVKRSAMPRAPEAQERGARIGSGPDDLDENRVRRLGLACGLVDVKVCAVDETWSGLKFVYRSADRG